MVVVKLQTIADHPFHLIVPFCKIIALFNIRALLSGIVVLGDFDIRIRLLSLTIIVTATCKRGQQDINRQDKNQHRERGEVPPALAVEDFDDHRSRARKQVLECEPDTAVLTDESRQKVFPNKPHRKASRFGILSALGTKLALKLGAAVEACCGLGFWVRCGLYFVLHWSRVLMWQR